MNYDIIIIGGGPGGYEAAIRAGQLGARIALVEKDKLGGTCLNRGCIPTKALYRNAEIMNTLKEADHFGIEVSDYKLNINKVHDRKDGIITDLRKGIHQLMKANQVEVIEGFGKITAKDEVTVTLNDGSQQVLKTKHIVIATGSRPKSVPVPGGDLQGLMTSRDILEMRQIPKRLVVVGGGVVGIEFAGIFNAFGTEVTVLSRSPHILKMIDTDITKRLASVLKKKGITIHTAAAASQFEAIDGGYRVTAQTKKGEVVIEADQVLLSGGRGPVVEGIGLEDLGIAYDRSGIQVNARYETNVSNIYAIGDVTGQWMLAHAASHNGIAVVEDIMGFDSNINQNLVPNCIFIFPEIASVGLTEMEAKEKGYDVNVSKFMFAANGKALALGESQGYVKVIECEGKLAGVHIMGPHASDLIHEGTLAINKGLTVRDIAETIHAHPTLSEAFVEATLGLHNEAIHMVPKKKRKTK